MSVLSKGDIRGVRYGQSVSDAEKQGTDIRSRKPCTPALVIDKQVGRRVVCREGKRSLGGSAQLAGCRWFHKSCWRRATRRMEGMLQIKVFGTTPPCARCKRAKAEAERAADKFSGQVEVVELDALGPEAEAYGLMSTPVTVVGDDVIGRGKVVPADRLVSIIERRMGGAVNG
jgi:hypothetical protein